jgi:antitoxin PrlF
MGKFLHSQSTLTDRYQTTVPEPVRNALHLNKRDKIEYVIDDSGKVMISRADEDDPILGKFLLFLANDIKNHPEHIKPINSALFARAKSLVSNIEIDLDAPLSDKDE